MVDGYDLYGDDLTPYEIRFVLWLLIWGPLGYVFFVQIYKRVEKLDNKLFGALPVFAFIGSFVLSYYVLRLLGWILLFDPF